MGTRALRSAEVKGEVMTHEDRADAVLGIGREDRPREIK